jgi:hypothetical protein
VIWLVLAVGGAVLVSVGVTVAIMDARQDSLWRVVAAERRARWEQRISSTGRTGR